MKSRKTILLAVMLLLALGSTVAQKKEESRLRTVTGIVIDKDENSIADAIVFLKNLKTQVVRTHISDTRGQYRFSGLDPNVDYEVHAEAGENTSSKRTVSSFDTRKEIVIHLKVDKKRSGK
jgi:hypothetical protein